MILIVAFLIVMLHVVMLNVITLSVVAPFKDPFSPLAFMGQ
jgi:hypothetical protein